MQVKLAFNEFLRIKNIVLSVLSVPYPSDELSKKYQIWLILKTNIKMVPKQTCMGISNWRSRNERYSISWINDDHSDTRRQSKSQIGDDLIAAAACEIPVHVILVVASSVVKCRGHVWRHGGEVWWSCVATWWSYVAAWWSCVAAWRSCVYVFLFEKQKQTKGFSGYWTVTQVVTAELLVVCASTSRHYSPHEIQRY